jgi:diguanylate cyclase (GGDEF)-like protein/PAS domain S-box-containing protein
MSKHRGKSKDKAETGSGLKPRPYAILDAVQSAADEILNADSIEKRLDTLMASIGEISSVSYALVFKSLYRNPATAEAVLLSNWTNPDIALHHKRQLTSTLAFIANCFVRWHQRISAGEKVFLRTQDFSEAERNELAEQDIKSILLIPILVDAKIWGILSFVDVEEPHDWPMEQVVAIQLAGSIIGAAIRCQTIAKALMDCEAKYHLLADSSSDIIELYNADGIMTFASPSIERVYGWRADEVIGSSSFDRIHPEDIGIVKEMLQQQISKGKSAYLQCRVQCKDGSYIWIESNVRPIREADGKIGKYLCVTQDISGRMMAEQTLQATNEQLQKTIVELENRNREAVLLNEMGDMLQSCMNVDEVYSVTAKFSKQFFLDYSGVLYIYDKNNQKYQQVSAWGKDTIEETSLLAEDCWGLRRGKTHIVQHSDTGLLCRHVTPYPAKSYTCCPLISQGEELGLLHIQGSSGKMPPRISQLAIIIAERTALALANLFLRETLQSQAIHDSLTGLFNRRYMDEMLLLEMRRATRRKQPIGLIMMDIDEFKTFNDQYGHDAGDALLQALGDYIQMHIRSGDVACRYGGDEFVIILSDAPIDDCCKRAKELKAGLNQLVITHQGLTLGSIKTSIGIACFPAHGKTPPDLLRSADMALYRAKHAGKNCVVVFEPLSDT